MSDISFNTARKELKIAQIALLNQLFQLLHLAHIYGQCFYEVSRMLMSKNVNNDVNKNSPITTVPWNAKHRTWHSRRTWCGNFIEELYERSGNINCKKHDLVNKQIDTDGRQLDSKLCDLIYLLVALILSHDLAKHKFA